MSIGADITQSSGLATLSRLYGFAGDAARFATEHINVLKSVDNALANRCGQIVEPASVGFGVGSETSLVLIGVGQALLGNPLTAGVKVAAGTKPIVMTCAAIGAVHYGWKALSDQERELLLSNVSKAFNVGIEFIRSIARFAYDMIKVLLSAENIVELKKMVGEAAAAFGKRLSAITGALSDRVTEASQSAASAATNAASTVWSYVPSLPGKPNPPPT